MAKKKKRPAPVPPQSTASTTASRKTLWPDALNLAVLAALAAYLASGSWFKWPDPIIDFGRELYLPWRLTQGAVLYKDDLHLYGPLSPYLNSLFFRIGGVGLTTLVAANVLIYAAILGLLYYFMREGWGRWPAFMSCAFFVGVFSFSHLVGIDNYNFLTPYSHEMTHGTLLLLCLVLVLRHVVRGSGAIATAAAGLLAGLSLLMKPEIILAAAALTAVAAVLIVIRDFRSIPWARWFLLAVIFVFSGFIPMTVSAGLFWFRGATTLHEALLYTNTAWLNALQAAMIIKDQFQVAALGLDHPLQNLAIEALWGGAAVGLAGGLAWAAGLFQRKGMALRIVMVLLLLALAAAATQVQWLNLGYALPGILLCGVVIEILGMRSARETPAHDRSAIARVLMWTAAAAMLMRMALSPRIYHYGFVQAAPAGVVGVAILMSSIPGFLRIEGRSLRWCQALLAVLVAGVIGVAVSNSRFFYSYHTLPVGEGDDQFLALDPNVAPGGLLVERARQYLAKDIVDNNVQSLLVMPEGLMLNYLTKLPNTIPYSFFAAPFVFAQGRNEDILQLLRASPPDRIVLISRDVREFGMARLGESPEHGQDLIDFVNRNYHDVFVFGDKDPLDPDRPGVVVFARNR